MRFSPAHLKWAEMARKKMDELYCQLELPNNFTPDFWEVHEQKIRTKLTPKVLKLLKDVYPYGPRYVDPPKEGSQNEQSIRKYPR